MIIYLVRHGETVEGQKGLILGHLDGQLSDVGKSEAGLLAEYFLDHDIKINEIISSDLGRAKQTAEIVAGKLELNVKFDVLVRERGAGVAEGKNEQEINWEEYGKVDLIQRKHLGGESFWEVKERARKFLKKLLERQENQSEEKILAVSHSVFILMVYAEITGVEVSEALKIKLAKKILKVDRGQVEWLEI